MMPIKVNSFLEVQRHLEPLPPEVLQKTVVVLDVDGVAVAARSPLMHMAAFFADIRCKTVEEQQHIFSRLYQEEGTKLIEENIFPEFIKRLKVKQVAFFYLTSFPSPAFGTIEDSVEARCCELKKFNILQGALDPFSERREECRIPSGETTYFVKQGIVFSHPYSKGEVLANFLESYLKGRFTHIVAVDDAEKNLSSIEEYCNDKYTVVSLHYYNPRLQEPLPPDDYRIRMGQLRGRVSELAKK